MKDVAPNAYGARRLTIELTNTCNLHCSYCLRDEDALYHDRAEFISIDLLKRVLREASTVAGITQVGFTGGEPTLYPNFSELIETCATAGIKSNFVTNGWHFEKLWPTLVDQRHGLSHISFSIDGATRETHDHWRGQGSFVRLIRAFSRCHKASLPFMIKTGIRRDTIEHLEEIALFAARMGAAGLNFSHILPTSEGVESDSSLNAEERRHAEEEIALLARIFKMKVGIDVGYYNVDPAAPCSPLAGVSCNIDYKGRLTLCCNLSGFRGAVQQQDIVADLNQENFSDAYERLGQLRELQLERRRAALVSLANNGPGLDLYIGSPCLFCLQSFGKIPWHAAGGTNINSRRPLPVARS
jgi:MoaA/NifB/PqqE/SkfB family radical SAM enzyme